MQYLRELCNQNKKWKPLEVNILRIETYLHTDGVMVLENCKAMVESVCKEILTDLNEAYSHNESIQNLVSKTCKKMKCISNITELTRSFVTVCQRLGEFRNSFATISHGQPMQLITQNQNKLVGASMIFLVTTIEQLIIFLITVYQDEYPIHVQSILRYEDNQEFNSVFDEQNEVIEIGQYGPYRPSEILFYIDDVAYKTELINFKPEDL